MADQEKEILQEEMEQDLSEAEELKEEEAGSEEPESREDKKAAKKQAKLNKKEDSYKEKIDQLEDRVKRQMAEFENFRKRTDKEKQAMFDTGAKSVIEKILPVVDNFERGLATVPEESKEDPFVDGMNRIYKQLMTELENIGVKPIEAVGQEFDPNLHNAVMQVESDEYESGVIAQELQKGYIFKARCKSFYIPHYPLISDTGICHIRRFVGINIFRIIIVRYGIAFSEMIYTNIFCNYGYI